jgi:hypothetical protein
MIRSRCSASVPSASRRRLPHELKLPRRTLLRGAVGGSLLGLALPPLEAMLNDNGTRLASGAELPRRLMTWVWGNGCRKEHWIPSTEGTGYTLPEELAPLAAVKSDITVLTGFHNYVAGRRGHHDGMAGLLSCHPFIQLDPMGAPYASKFGGPSIDQVTADVVGHETYYRSLQIGVSKRFMSTQGPTLATMSHRGPDEPMEMERDPNRLYDKLFMSFTPVDDPAAGVRKKALDVVANDAARIKKRVSSNDGKRIDAHLESIFQLQKQIMAIPPQCELPGEPDVPPFMEDGAEPLWDINQVMSQLVVLAFSCDLTRVISYMFTGPSGGAQFYMLPPSEFPSYPGGDDYSHSDHHNVSHVNLAYEQAFIHKSVVHSMENLAYLLESLKGHEEGEGTLLDGCAVLAGSDVTEGWAHSEDDYPIIVAGNARGRLKTGVGHYRSGDAEGIHNISLACVKAVLPNPDDVMQIGSNTGSYEGLTSTPCAAIYPG